MHHIIIAHFAVPSNLNILCWGSMHDDLNVSKVNLEIKLL